MNNNKVTDAAVPHIHTGVYDDKRSLVTWLNDLVIILMNVQIYDKAKMYFLQHCD
uniref:Uncharacterized protein n=1 Tax=Rhizophagus irregularis (strain DAOM 181602 / DAOM 197198 / MUCL 43194) TaxID=747089 RepID=U9TYE1_RHIID